MFQARLQDLIPLMDYWHFVKGLLPRNLPCLHVYQKYHQQPRMS